MHLIAPQVDDDQERRPWSCWQLTPNGWHDRYNGITAKKAHFCHENIVRPRVRTIQFNRPSNPWVCKLRVWGSLSVSDTGRNESRDICTFSQNSRSKVTNGRRIPIVRENSKRAGVICTFTLYTKLGVDGWEKLR